MVAQLCNHCHRREAKTGRRKCEPCLAHNNKASRAYYARHHAMYPEPTRSRALKFLSMFIMTPRDLSCALDIPINHASTVLHRLWEQGRCERWPYTDRSYRYRVKE